jgi:hypothetical protein
MPVFNNILAGAAGSAGGAAAADFKIERSLRFDSGVSAHLDRAFSSSANRKKYTISFWIKRCNIGTQQRIYTTNANSYLMFNSSDYLHGNTRGTSGSNNFWYTNQSFRDPSAWYHIVAVYDIGVSTPGLEIYVNGIKASIYGNIGNYDQHDGGTHTIGGISYFLDAYLAEYHHLDGIKINGTTDTDGSVTGTAGAVYLTDFGEFDDNGIWQPKAYSGSHGAHGFYLDFKDNSSSSALGNDAAGSNDWTVTNFTTSANPLYHTNGSITNNDGRTDQSGSFAAVFNGTANAQASDAYGFLNGSFDFTWNLDTPIAYSNSVEVWTGFGSGSLYLNGGSAVGSANNNWATLVSGSSGTISSIRFTQGSSGGWWAGVRVDGNVLVNGVPGQIDSLIDSPSSYQADSGNNGGNYATFNLFDSENGTLSNGNLTTNQTNTSTSFGPQNTTMGFNSGKWYCEFTFDSGTYALAGITHAPSQSRSGTTWHRDAHTYTWYFSGAFMSAAWPGTSTFPDGSNPKFTTGDVVGVLLDKDNDKLYFTKNGAYVASMNAATGANGIDISAHSGETAFFTVGNNASTATQWSLNAGQRPFVLSSLPTGYKPLCTQYLDDSTYASIPDGSSHFAASTWTIPSGNADTTISGLNFGPDWLWLKNRSASSEGSAYDRLLGDDKYLKLFSTNNGNHAATTAATRLNFTNDGYVLEGGNDNANYGAGQLGVGWAWNAGTTNTSSSTGSQNSASYTTGVYASKWNDTSSPGSTGTVNSGANAFNGNLTNYASLNTSNAFTKWKPNTPIQINSSLRVLASGISGGANQVAVNGTYFTVTSSPVWYTIDADYLIEIRLQDTGPTHGRLWAVEVDGKILVDQNETPPDRPSISSTYRANQAAGFSIVKYTGNSNLTQTLEHGLNRVPELIIGKNTGSTYDWSVYTKGTTAAGYLRLNTTDAYTGSTGIWGNQEPTSSVFFVGNDGNNNQNNVEHVAYCFAPITGFSSFGTYDGNSSSDGPFVYTGFRPAFILLKNQGSGIRSWEVYDSTRDPYNAAERSLLTNNSVNETTGSERVDFLANGFKIRTSANGINAATPIYYAAFAEHPFKFARAR